MEKEGFIRCVENIQNNLNLKIAVISTDRHIQIKKLMQEDTRFNDIVHQFDRWHIAKGISKKLSKVAKKRGNLIFVK